MNAHCSAALSRGTRAPLREETTMLKTCSILVAAGICLLGMTEANAGRGLNGKTPQGISLNGRTPQGSALNDNTHQGANLGTVEGLRPVRLILPGGAEVRFH